MPAQYKLKLVKPHVPINKNNVYNALVKIVVGKFSLHRAAADCDLKKSTLSVQMKNLKEEFKVEELTLKILDEAFEKGTERSKF
jgi:hypothetical protein